MPGLPVDPPSVESTAKADHRAEENVSKTSKNLPQHSALASLAASYGGSSGSGSEDEDEVHSLTHTGLSKRNGSDEVANAKSPCTPASAVVQEMLIKHTGDVDEVNVSIAPVNGTKNGVTNDNGQSSSFSKIEVGEVAHSTGPDQAFTEIRSDVKLASSSETSDSDSDSSSEDEDSSGSNTMR